MSGNETECPQYNTMQEVLHLVFNTVAAACHSSLHFTNDFLDEFALDFKSVYLDKITDHWYGRVCSHDRLYKYKVMIVILLCYRIKTKGESMKLDSLAFAGFDPLEELLTLGICATKAFEGIHNLEFFDRDFKLNTPLRKRK